jgi:hypothetical protein
VPSSSDDSVTQLLSVLNNKFDEMDRKIDIMNQREVIFEKKIENVEKGLGGLLSKVNKVILFTSDFFLTKKSLKEFTRNFKTR